MEADARTRRATAVANLERAGEEGRRVLAEHRAEEERRALEDRVVIESRAADAYWGGLVGRVRQWRRRRLQRRYARSDAYHRREVARREARGEIRR